jgi:hypothetical protein
MKFLNTNILAAGIGSVIIATFALLFYTDITKKADAGVAELIGTITFKRKVAHRKYGSQVVWEELEQNEKIYNYDSIRTADLSEAIIHLEDGTEIALNENSMILLALSKDEIDLEFSRGSISAKRDELKDHAKNLSIFALGTTVLVGKSDVNLYRPEGMDLNLTVNRGDATIKAGEAEKLVKADQRVVVSKDNKEVKVLTINLRLKSPPPSGYFLTTSDATAINFSWDPVKGKWDVYFEISRDDQFNDIVTSNKVFRNAKKQVLRRGIYYWRLRAVSRSKETEYSDVRRLSIIGDKPVELIAPLDGGIYSYRSVLPIVTFKWSKSNIASAYTLIIAEDQAMNTVVQRVQTPDTSIAIDALKKGTYFWRVDTSIGLRGISNLQSRVHKLNIEEKREIEPPALLYPPDKNHLSRALLEKHHITFSWKMNPEIESSSLFIARDKDFKDILFTYRSKVNFLQFKEILPIGKFFWRVSGELKGGELTNPSIARSLMITESEPIELILPADNAVIDPGQGETRPSVKFVWARTDVKGRFHLDISRDKNFSSLYKEHDGEGNAADIPRLEPGRYFWRVSLRDDDGSQIMRSSYRTLLIQEKLAEPVVISPRSGSVVNMRDRNSFPLRWGKSKNATLYRIGLHRVKRGRAYNIMEKTISQTNYTVHELKRLDEGRFFWTLQALETDRRSNRVIAMSPTVKTYFEITLGKPFERVKLRLPKTLYPE